MIQAIVRLRLFSRTEPAKSFWSILKWWELRRIPYNIIVGLAGLTGSFMMVGTALLADQAGAEIEFPDPPLFVFAFAFLYGVMANICYTGGWISELAARWIWKDRVEAYGEVAFTFGTLFSVMLTLFPPCLFSLIYFVMYLEQELH